MPDYWPSKSQNFRLAVASGCNSKLRPLIACRLGKAENRVSVFARPKATLIAAQVANERNFFCWFLVSFFFIYTFSVFLLFFQGGGQWKYESYVGRKNGSQKDEKRSTPFCIDDAAGFPRIWNR